MTGVPTASSIVLALLRRAAALLVACRLDLHVDGAEHIPARGAAVIACRHVHHLYDACALQTATPRELHFLVAFDWAGPRLRPLMEHACRSARSPVLLRSERLGVPGGARGYQPLSAGLCPHRRACRTRRDAARARRSDRL